MTRIPRLARLAFALGMIGLGVLIFRYGDFALGWPSWVPWRRALVDGLAGMLLLGGAGLLFARSVRVAVGLLRPCLLLWAALRVPALVHAPLVEVNWLAVGEIAALAAGAWALFGAGGRLVVRALFGGSLVAFGLSHFFYTHETVVLVPSWLPFRRGWAYLTGAGHTAAGLGVLLSIRPRLAAALEAAMLAIFTVVVWAPAISARSATRDAWWEFVLSWAIAAAAWVVAGSIPPRDHAIAEV